MACFREDLLAEQRAFFRHNRSGCAFAAHAAKDMDKFGWKQAICPISAEAIDEALGCAISDPKISTLSILLPDVKSALGIVELVDEIRSGKLISALPNEAWNELTLYKIRAQIGSDVSWVSGFGPFQFLPPTRQAPVVELTTRVKERPRYDWYFKETPEGIIHLADMSMNNMSDRNLQKLWSNSFLRTNKLLGHPPDEASAAKTTFAVPTELIKGISV